MALTEKGQAVLSLIKEHYPSGSFSAKDLSDASGQKVYAATLNSIADNGFIT